MLVVEDDEPLLDLMASVLAAHPYELWLATTAADARRALRRGLPDLMIVDLGLPDGDGFALLSEARQTSDTPVIVCSGIADKHAGILRSLKLGADDFIGKPFDARELEARVEAVLRRSLQTRSSQNGVAQPERLASGALRIDRARRQVWWGDQALHLTSKEFLILVALIGRPGEIFSHQELAQVVWGAAAPRRDAALSSHVRGLRAKLGTAATIAAVPGFGYRFSP